MQEILFRGKPKSNNEYYCFSQVWRNNCRDGFVYGSLIIQADRYFICVSTVGVKMNCCINNSTVSIIEVIPETVGQYTGITDDYGKKIFKGDILGITNDDHDYDYITKVYLDCNTLCVDVQGQDYDYTSIGFAIEIWDDECDQLEVIGNIYDNPELLKEFKE